MKTSKNLILVKGALILGILFFITNCRKDHDQPCEKGPQEQSATSTANRLENFDGEDDINLNPHIMSVSIGNSEISRFIENFSTPSALSALVDSIGPNDFDPLLDSAIAMRSSHTGCGNFITALKFCYGLNSAESAITLLYQPVYYCRTSYNSVTKKGHYEVVNPSADIFYVYNHSSNKFVTASATDIACIARYKAKVSFSHGPSATPMSFDQSNADDNLKDVEALYYSFQEIAALIEDNGGSYLKIYNAFKEVTIDGVPVYRHDLLLAPAKFDSSGPVAGSFLNSFADLSHLCPPSCNGDDFSLD